MVMEYHFRDVRKMPHDEMVAELRWAKLQISRGIDHPQYPARIKELRDELNRRLDELPPKLQPRWDRPQRRW